MIGFSPSYYAFKCLRKTNVDVGLFESLQSICLSTPTLCASERIEIWRVANAIISLLKP